MSLDTTDRRYTYVLKLCCDSPRCAVAEEIIGKTQQGCLRSAERDGWTISANKISAFCPACTMAMNGLSAPDKGWAIR